MNEHTTRQRIRLTFAKGTAMRYTSHLDVARAWERTLRRAEIPLLYSQGFNPRPQIQFAAALPLGYDGKQELLDMTLTRPVSLSELSERIVAALPQGLTLLQAEEVPVSSPALQAIVCFATYHAYLEEGSTPDEVLARVERFLGETVFPWTRRSHKGKVRQVDLRAMVNRLALRQTAGGRLVLEMRLRNDNAGAGRPDEVIAALDLTGHARLIERTGLEFSGQESDVRRYATRNTQM